MAAYLERGQSRYNKISWAKEAKKICQKICARSCCNTPAFTAFADPFSPILSACPCIFEKSDHPPNDENSKLSKHCLRVGVVGGIVRLLKYCLRSVVVGGSVLYLALNFTACSPQPEPQPDPVDTASHVDTTTPPPPEPVTYPEIERAYAADSVLVGEHVVFEPRYLEHMYKYGHENFPDMTDEEIRDRFALHVARMDTLYEGYAELTGETPTKEYYGGRVYFGVDSSGNYNYGDAWCFPGQNRIYLDNTKAGIGKWANDILKEKEEWSDYMLHEMGHAFDGRQKLWWFDAESLAELKVMYATEVLGAKTFHGGYNLVGDNHRQALIKSHPQGYDLGYGYTKFEHRGAAHNGAYMMYLDYMVTFAVEAADGDIDKGWEAVKTAFRRFNNMTYTGTAYTEITGKPFPVSTYTNVAYNNTYGPELAAVFYNEIRIAAGLPKEIFKEIADKGELIAAVEARMVERANSAETVTRSVSLRSIDEPTVCNPDSER